MNVKRNAALTAILCLLVLWAGLYFRAYPLVKVVPDDVKEKATSLVLARLKQHSARIVDSQYPEASSYDKSRLIKQIFDEILRKESRKVRQTIRRIEDQWLEQGPRQRRYPYLLASDSYYYLGLTKNILREGRIAGKIKGSKYFNPLMLAPLGHWEPLNLHPYIGYGLYRTLSVSDRTLPFRAAAGYTPMVIFTASLALFFLVGRQLQLSACAWTAGAVYFSLAPVYLRRSAWGWYDNDPYNILFPLLIIAVFFAGLRRTHSFKQSLPFAVAGFLMTGVYSLFWQGWVYLFCITFTAWILIGLYARFSFRNNTRAKDILVFGGLWHAGGFLCVSVIFGPGEFFTLFHEGWEALKNFMTPQLGLWPDLFMSVGELKKPSLWKYIEITGGIPFFSGTAIGFAVMVRSLWKDKDWPRAGYYLTFLLFFAVAFLITLGAERFALLSVVPMAFIFSCAMEWINRRIIDRIMERSYPGRKSLFLKNCLKWLLAVLLVLFPLSQSGRIMSAWRPIFNDTWKSVLEEIKRKTPPDTIVNTWWPPGHFITSIAERRVTFDGATINTPQAYWLANVFLSGSEREAAGLLRMLNNSANRATEYLTQKADIPLSQAVRLLKHVTPKNTKQARAALAGELDEKQTDELLALTHGNPPPSLLMVYNELMEKNLELSFVGRWNFEAVEKLNANPQALGKIPPRGSKDYIRFLWDMVGGPLNYSRELAQLSREGHMYYFEEGLSVDMMDKSCSIRSQEFGEGVPTSLFYLEEQSLQEIPQEKPTLQYSVVLIKKARSSHAVLMDTRLARSLLVRLYYFGGAGLEFFEPFLEDRDLTGRTVINVYRINWERFRQIPTP